MTSSRARGAVFVVVTAIGLLTTISAAAQSSAQGLSFGVCKPVSERSSELGCWILADPTTSAIHVHSGPEAWYTQAGETCLEIPGGKLLASNDRDTRLDAEGFVQSAIALTRLYDRSAH